MSRKAAKRRVRGASQIMAQAQAQGDGTMLRSGFGSLRHTIVLPKGRMGGGTGRQLERARRATLFFFFACEF